MKTCKKCISFRNDNNECSCTGEKMSDPEKANTCRGYIPSDPKEPLDPEIQQLLDNTPPTPPEWKYKISRESLAETLLIEFCKDLHITNVPLNLVDEYLENLSKTLPKFAISLVDKLIEELKTKRN